jgi:hypothetical protein
MKWRNQMNLDTILENFNVINEEYKAKLQDTFQKAFAAFWEEHPKIVSVSWLQYTDYFNDGEECIFRARDMVPFTNRMVKKDNWNSTYIDRYDYVPDKDDMSESEYNSAIDALDKILELPSNVFLDTYGDHVRVTVYKDGTTVLQVFTDHD